MKRHFTSCGCQIKIIHVFSFFLSLSVCMEIVEIVVLQKNLKSYVQELNDPLKQLTTNWQKLQSNGHKSTHHKRTKGFFLYKIKL